MQVTAKLVPIITEITLTQKKLDLTDEEMSDKEALKQYIQDYYTPIGFQVTDIL